LYSKFIQLLALLPNLKSLTILSLSSFKLKCLSQKIKEIWPSDNQITKLVVESINEETDLEKIQYFIDLCPRMKYLKVKCENHFHMELIVRNILMKNINKCLDWNLFCLCIPIANDDMINQLQIMIDSERLIDGFRLTRTTDRIYLQWNFN
jgi:predicted glycosyltransferase involved in capsule biosynthesis